MGKGTFRNFNYFRPKGCCYFCPVSCVFLMNMGLFNAWRTSGQINGLSYRVEDVMKQLVHTSCYGSSRNEALGKFGEH